MVRKSTSAGRKIFGVLKLRLLNGKDEDYELIFQPMRPYRTVNLKGRFSATRAKTARILTELGIDDPKATVFEAGSLGAASRHVSLSMADVEYLKRFLEGGELIGAGKRERK